MKSTEFQKHAWGKGAEIDVGHLISGKLEIQHIEERTSRRSLPAEAFAVCTNGRGSIVVGYDVYHITPGDYVCIPEQTSYFTEPSYFTDLHLVILKDTDPVEGPSIGLLEL